MNLQQMILHRECDEREGDVRIKNEVVMLPFYFPFNKTVQSADRCEDLWAMLPETFHTGNQWLSTQPKGEHT